MQAYNIDSPERVPAHIETRVLGIEGMTCDKCVETLTRALKKVQGIQNVQVSRQEARASITFDNTQTNIPAIHETILRAGYRPTSALPS